MKIHINSVVFIRYQMKNSKGEILETNMSGLPVLYLHGAVNLPVFTDKLTGLEPGSIASLFLGKAESNGKLDDDFLFDVIIDDVREATEEEIKLGQPIPSDSETKVFCGPDCIC